MEGLVFQYAGPIASFGTVATGEHRRTEASPTKSGILGLVGAALGVDRKDAEFFARAHKSLGFASRTEGNSTLFTDFHTVQTLKEVQAKRIFPRTRADAMQAEEGLYTTVTRRDYVSDVYARIALWTRGSSDPLLSEIEEGLRSPVFSLYLGRRACPPMLPFHPQRVAGRSPRELLDAAEFPNAELLDMSRLLSSHLLYTWEDDSTGSDSIRIRRDAYDGSGPRRFLQREESWATEVRS